MTPRTYRSSVPRRESLLAAAGGFAFAVGLFVLMALAQMLGERDAPEAAVAEESLAFKAPEIEQVEEEEPPPEEEPPELEEEPPQLSLDQLDIALNPGTGSLAGDFALPGIDTAAAGFADDFVDFSNLDQVPRPVGASGFHFPRRLLKDPADGRIVLLLKISKKGEVLGAEIETSNLPRFNDVVLNQVKAWRFTPPTQQGKPVRAQARLPVPIRIR